MHEALHFTRVDKRTVECRLCPHRCRIVPGKRGICGVRENQDGTLVSLVYGKLAASHVDPVEKKPLFHFLPGTLTYSIATVGCNLACPFCQNHELSFAMRSRSIPYGYDASAEEVVAEAVASGCESLTFTYSEPTIFFEYMIDIAALAREKGLLTTVVSNGFIESEPRNELAGLIDAANIDLKAFQEKTYRSVLKGKLEPVLETISSLVARGIWTEVTTLVVPEMNDSADELKQIASFIASVSLDVPWHVSRFFPHNQWTQGAPTSDESLRRAVDAGRKAGLRYVYAGNVPGDLSESTFCPGCGKKVIERFGFNVSRMNLGPDGRCPSCSTLVAGVFKAGNDR